MNGERDLKLSEQAEEMADWLADEIAKAKKVEPPKPRKNYARFREDSKQSWESVAGEGALYERIGRLVSSSILLPRQGFQLPIATAYLMLPSALCNTVPILFSQGASGSGKSTLGYLACAIHDCSPISAGSTFASIRNTIKESRLYDKSVQLDVPGNEKNAALVWEDIKPEDLLVNEGNIFSLLKNGVTRSGTITIADKEGGNLVFKVFSPKLISSIHPIYAQLQFRELVRRMIVVQHKPSDKWVSEDFDEWNSEIDPLDLIDLADLDWCSLTQEFNAFWEQDYILDLWVETNRSLARIKQHGMSSPLYKMSRDLICTGLVTGIWQTKQEALDHMAAYWEWHVGNIESQSTATQKALSNFIENRTATLVKQNKDFQSKGLHQYVTPIEIEAKELKLHVDTLRSQGELDTQATTQDINNAMQALGWRLRPNVKKVNSWQHISG